MKTPTNSTPDLTIWRDVGNGPVPLGSQRIGRHWRARCEERARQQNGLFSAHQVPGTAADRPSDHEDHGETGNRGAVHREHEGVLAKSVSLPPVQTIRKR